MSRGVPGFLEVVPGYSRYSERCSGGVPRFLALFRVFRGVPWCSGVFHCVPYSAVPGITTCLKVLI